MFAVEVRRRRANRMRACRRRHLDGIFVKLSRSSAATGPQRHDPATT
jgi:hypothetical protein